MQGVAIARALANDPDIILADELNKNARLGIGTQFAKLVILNPSEESCYTSRFKILH